MNAAVFFATRGGHTCRVAEHIADDLRDRGVAVDVFDVRDLPLAIDWDKYGAVCVAASVHAGRHEREMVRFVIEHRTQLEFHQAAFLSVSLSEVTVEDPLAPADRRTQARLDVQRMIDDFIAATGWRPATVMPVAGALLYRRYNFIIRFIMKRIARKAGGPTDTSRNYEFTDWPAIDRFVDETLRPACAHT
ncbi:MAG TPA: flavodoxin domain-containing protein [Vicinamibacterales bacterium]|nr:flavodoxin domain-containing protein [Vicinamibacterales bacterium]